jgi:protein-L-isoaspartate(D-aspartate) O-methyltransferase
VQARSISWAKAGAVTDSLAAAQRALIEQLRREGIRDERVLAAMSRVPRVAFVPAEFGPDAYQNVALPIGHGQTISQPFVVALMTESLTLSGTEHVLEVGTGSGYQAALLAELAQSVVSVERVPALLDAARRALANLGYTNVELHIANGTLGWPPGAPYDRILVAAGGPAIPASLVDQLAVDGRLVMPVGKPREQQLVIVRRIGGRFDESVLGPVRFVPLVGAEGWPESLARDDADS